MSRGGDGFALQIVFVGRLDEVAHHAGPESEELHVAVQEVDRQIERFVECYKRVCRRVSFIVMGVDGLVPIRQRVDVEEKILHAARNHQLRRGRDFVYFLDSTAVRLWFRSPVAKAAFEAFLASDAVLVESGKVFTRADAQRLRLPAGDRRYGDLLWWANAGVLVTPNFFHVGECLQGMHGYDPKTPDHQSTLVLWGDDVKAGFIPALRLHEVSRLIRDWVLQRINLRESPKVVAKASSLQDRPLRGTPAAAPFNS